MFLLDLVKAQKQQGRAAGIYSICSANPHVLVAGMQQAKQDDTVVCVETTANQVNQLGGYTGMKPADFIQFIRGLAAEQGFPMERVLLGGDHLGPLVWAGEPAAQAMEKAKELVRQYVASGYVKIHLDSSMRCADDPGDERTPLDPRVICERAAQLCEVCEAAHRQLPKGSPPPVYVIGTDVPIPGGEQVEGAPPVPTRTADLEHTIALSREAFARRGLEQAWSRVIAVVVQPGVEFGDAVVFEYEREKARALTQQIKAHPGLVFEAHSTDYQTRDALAQMVQDHYAILKVGPGLTFALREGVFALAQMEQEWLGDRKGVTLSRMREVLDEVMVREPGNWKKHYRGDEAALRFARKYSFSDRSRYYWPHPEVSAALSRLLQNLTQHPAPLTLLSQYLPAQYEAVRLKRLPYRPEALLQDKVLQVMDDYAHACGMR